MITGIIKQQQYQFKSSIERNHAAAKRIVPVVAEIVGFPNSVVDLGGGAGNWCKAFKVFEDMGVKQVTSIDNPSVRSEDLLISEDNCVRCNLDKELPPVRTCDLAMSIEFAEHVPLHRSEAVVNFLTRSSSVVLFSAAIPRQGGIGHINEQRPDFWRKLFEDRGFQMVDAVRCHFLFNNNIRPFLRQNIYLYIAPNKVSELSISPEYNRVIPDELELLEKSTLKKPWN